MKDIRVVSVGRPVIYGSDVREVLHFLKHCLCLGQNNDPYTRSITL